MRRTKAALRIQVLIMAVLLICTCGFFQAPVYAETDYSYIEVDMLEKIKNNPEALEQVQSISAISYEKKDCAKIAKQLKLVSLCPNVDYLYICVNGLHLDKEFFDSLPEGPEEIALSFQWGSVDFEGVQNANVVEIYLSENEVSHFSGIGDFPKLRILNMDSVSGFQSSDFPRMEQLQELYFVSQRIEDYKELFGKIPNVECLSLEGCNFQNADTIYLKDLKNLSNLQLYGAFVDDITYLKKCKKLSFLGLPLGLEDLSALYDMPYLSQVEFDAYTELHVDEDLVKFFDDNDIYYPRFDRKISQKVDAIVKSLNIQDSMSEREIIERVTEYVLLNMSCDEEIMEERLNNDSEGHWTTLDTDINYGVGVCHWYAILEYTLLKCVGIDAYYVVGYAMDSVDCAPGSHAWNMVKLDGGWYGLDPLWIDDDNNDPTTPEYKESGWQEFYMRPTKTDDYSYFPEYSMMEDYMDKYFPLYHRTMNDPQDTEIMEFVVVDQQEDDMDGTGAPQDGIGAEKANDAQASADAEGTNRQQGTGAEGSDGQQDGAGASPDKLDQGADASGTETGNAVDNAGSANTVIIVICILVIICVVGGGVFVFLKKKGEK